MSIFSTVADLVSNRNKRSLVDIPYGRHIQLSSDIIISLTLPVTCGEPFRERTQRHLLNRTKSCLHWKILKWLLRLYLHIPNILSPSIRYDVLCSSYINNILHSSFWEDRHFRYALQMFFLKYCWGRLGILSHMSTSLIYRPSQEKPLLS